MCERPRTCPCLLRCCRASRQPSPKPARRVRGTQLPLQGAASRCEAKPSLARAPSPPLRSPFFYLLDPAYWFARFSSNSNNLRTVEKVGV